MVGPTLFGSHGELPVSWVGVHSVLVDAYVKMNREVCQMFPYASHLDTKAAFVSQLKDSIANGVKPKDLTYLVGLDWKNNDAYNEGNMGGILTFDGEHTNLEGTALILYMFIDQVTSLNWA